MRITVYDVLEYLASGMTEVQILDMAVLSLRKHQVRVTELSSTNIALTGDLPRSDP